MFGLTDAQCILYENYMMIIGHSNVSHEYINNDRKMSISYILPIYKLCLHKE